MKTILTILLALLANLGYAQANKSYVIHIKANPSAYRGEFGITIKREKEYTKIFYSKQDSVEKDSPTKEKELEQIRQRFAESNSSLPTSASTKIELTGILEAFDKKYKVYQQDSLLLENSKYEMFVKAMDAFILSPEASLTREEELKSRLVVLDGTLVHVTVETNGKTVKDFFTHSPTTNSHPEVYSLIHEPLNLYRAQHPNSFLDKKYTSNY